jgi:hypothetical protein
LAGMAFSPTEGESAYHWPRSSRTESDPGKVSRFSSSWVTSWVGDRSEERANEAFT